MEETTRLSEDSLIQLLYITNRNQENVIKIQQDIANVLTRIAQNLSESNVRTHSMIERIVGNINKSNAKLTWNKVLEAIEEESESEL